MNTHPEGCRQEESGHWFFRPNCKLEHPTGLPSLTPEQTIEMLVKLYLSFEVGYYGELSGFCPDCREFLSYPKTFEDHKLTCRLVPILMKASK
jgi:hypothetical protein